ncbi:hypothetical protein BT69DRAFT_1342955, partial [Atractiella rhizophila]
MPPSHRNSISTPPPPSYASTSSLDFDSDSDDFPSMSRTSSVSGAGGPPRGRGASIGLGLSIPGFAVASSKRNMDFHALFKGHGGVPEDDYLIEDYGCALQREILLQGRLYISEHHLCFYANIFGWVTT